ncbi:MAG: hypothetical protein M3N68_13645, partial [Actinomycetota bacterium]|nr:hypothetical protein [Actinomycetota bacterium]
PRPWAAAVAAERATATAAPEPAEDADEAVELPIEGYDRMRVAQILPLLPSLDLDELAAVREHEEQGRNRGTIIRRVDQLMDELEEELDEGAEQAEESVPSGWSAAGADRTTRLPTVSPEAAAGEAELPIEGYDEMRVSQILPLLPTLGLEELAAVREHEEEGRNRGTVIRRVDELMDRLEEAEGQAVEPEGPPTVVTSTGARFPIEDYDRRTVGEILARLDDLSDEELDVVAERERAGKNRAVVLNAIDAQFEDVGEEERAEDLEVEPAAEEEPPAPVAAGPAGAAGADFPIEGYGALRVNQVLELLPTLDLDQLQAVRRREQQGKNRSTLLRRLDERIAELQPGGGAEVDLEDLEMTEEEAEPVEDEGFPIPDYDRLTVGEIVSLLDDLSNEELDMVAEREERGKNRAAVLDAIDDLFEDVDDGSEPEIEDLDRTATIPRVGST